MATKASNPAADIENCPNLPALERDELGHLVNVPLHTLGEGRPTAGEHQPIPLHLDPVLVGLGDAEFLGGHVGEPDAVAAGRPRQGGPVPFRAGDAAADPFVGAGAVALAVLEVVRGEAVLAGGVLAWAVGGEVGGAEGDRGEVAVGDRGEGVGGGVAGEEVEVGAAAGRGREGEGAEEAVASGAEVGKRRREGRAGVLVDAEEVGEDAEESGEKSEGQGPAVGAWEDRGDVESGHLGVRFDPLLLFTCSFPSLVSPFGNARGFWGV